MNGIDFESKREQLVRIKFLLGELVLASWHPLLLVLNPVEFNLPGWPVAPGQLNALINSNTDGLFCRKVSLGKFKSGIDRYGQFLSYVSHSDKLYYVDTTGNFEDYLKQLSSKSRQNLTRSVRRFTQRQASQVTWTLHTTPDEIKDFHKEAVAISQQTYQTKLLDSGLSATADFLDEMVQAASLHKARGYLLHDCGKAIAYAWCFQQGRRLIYNNIGYLPEFAEHSPGSVLLYHILEDTFNCAEINVLDFGPGEAIYKSIFSTGYHEFVDVYLLKNTFRNYILLKLHWYIFNLSTFLGYMLHRLGIKKQIKILIRRLKLQ